MRRNALKTAPLCLFLTLLLLTAFFALPVFAKTARVVDEAGRLTSSQCASLEDRIAEIAKKNDFDVVVLFVRSLKGQSASVYADDYFDENGYGYGSGRDGILLLVSVGDREWYISTSGAGIDCFSDADLDKIGDRITPDLADGDYYSAAETFLSNVESTLNPSFPIMGELIIAAVAAIIATAIALYFKKSMNTARAQTSAARYTTLEGIDMKAARDTYLYSTITKVKIQSDSPSGGHSGSSTHTSSSGHSHGGRGGHF